MVKLAIGTIGCLGEAAIRPLPRTATAPWPVAGQSIGPSVPGTTLVDVTRAEPSTVFEGQGLKVTALGIPHANMPTLAYRVETGDGSIVFSSDQNGTDPKFVDFARNADVLIMHMQIPVGATSPLHAAPAVVGRIAEQFASEREQLEKQWDRGEDVNTEDLRQAIKRYRAFFDRLLAATRACP